MTIRKAFNTSAYIAIGTVWASATPLIVRAETAVLSNPFGSDTPSEPIYIIARITQAVLGVVGAITLLVFIYGGFKLIFSGGNEEKINKGRSTLLWAVIGLAIILSSYAILDYTFSLFQAAAQG